MYYAPQPWLADWSALTDEIVKANEEGEDNMSKGMYERKEHTAVCQTCGSEYLTKSYNGKYCPECRKQRDYEYFMAYNARRRKGVSTPDVPDVPADDYDTLEEKIKKTAPIETVLVPKKEDNMDTERAERLKTFPSLSNMTEHPEYFTGDTPESLGQTKTVPDDYGTTKDIPDEKEAFDTLKKARGSLLEEITSDKKRMLLALYDGMTDMCMASGMTFAEMLDRMSRLHAALS